MAKNYKSLSDEQLIKNVKNKGCDPSFLELSSRYQNLFYKICHRYSPAIRAVGWNPEDVFLDKDHAIFDCINKFNPKKGVKFSTWMGNYSRYLCLGVINRRKRLVEFDTESSEAILGDVEQVQEFQQSRDRGCLENIQFYFSLISDERFKKVLLLRYYSPKDLTWKQISQEMNVSVQTAISLHNRALLTLKHKIKTKDNL